MIATDATVLPPRGERQAWAPFALVEGLRVYDPDDAPGTLVATERGFAVCWDDQATDDVHLVDGRWVTDYGVEIVLVRRLACPDCGHSWLGVGQPRLCDQCAAPSTA